MFGCRAMPPSTRLSVACPSPPNCMPQPPPCVKATTPSTLGNCSQRFGVEPRGDVLADRGRAVHRRDHGHVVARAGLAVGPAIALERAADERLRDRAEFRWPRHSRGRTARRSGCACEPTCPARSSSVAKPIVWPYLTTGLPGGDRRKRDLVAQLDRRRTTARCGRRPKSRRPPADRGPPRKRCRRRASRPTSMGRALIMVFPISSAALSTREAVRVGNQPKARAREHNSTHCTAPSLALRASILFFHRP